MDIKSVVAKDAIDGVEGLTTVKEVNDLYEAHSKHQEQDYKWSVDIAHIQKSNEWHFCIGIPDFSGLGVPMIMGVVQSRDDAIDEVANLMKKSDPNHLVL